MKKYLAAALLALPQLTWADFIGVHAGYSVWQGEFSGKIAGMDKYRERLSYGWTIPSFEDRGFDKENHSVYYLAFEHPLPLIPNIRLDYSDIAESGSSPKEVESRRVTFSIDGLPQPITIDIAQKFKTDLELQAADATLYYEILDNWISLDLGLTIRKMAGEFVESTYPELTPAALLGGTCGDFVVNQSGLCIIPVQTDKTDFDLILPMLYGSLRFDLPLSGAYAEGLTKFISFDGSLVLDWQLEAGYMFDFTVSELGFALGYRQSKLEADDLEDLYADAKLEGLYGSLKFHF